MAVNRRLASRANCLVPVSLRPPSSNPITFSYTLCTSPNHLDRCPVRTAFAEFLPAACRIA
jgi:hypothetical protein